MKALLRSEDGGRCLAALACLLAFSLGPVPLFPMVFSWAAEMEGSHSVQFERLSEGGTKVVLQHMRKDICKHGLSQVGHRHGLASKMICLVALAPGLAGDHIAVFTGLGAAEDQSTGPQIQPRIPKPLKPVVAAGSNPAELRSDPHHGPGDEAGSCGQIPLSTLAWQRSLRSMCLLI